MPRWEMGMEKPQPFARVLGWIRGCCRARRSPRPPRFAPMVLERLEERYVMAALAGVAGPGPYSTAPTAWFTEKKAAILESGADQGDGATDTDLVFTLPSPGPGSHQGLTSTSP